MAMYPNMMQPIPFVKQHKAKHPQNTEQEKAQNQTSNEKNNVGEQKNEVSDVSMQDNNNQKEQKQE